MCVYIICSETGDDASGILGDESRRAELGCGLIIRRRISFRTQRLLRCQALFWRQRLSKARPPPPPAVCWQPLTHHLLPLSRCRRRDLARRPPEGPARAPAAGIPPPTVEDFKGSDVNVLFFSLSHRRRGFKRQEEWKEGRSPVEFFSQANKRVVFTSSENALQFPPGRRNAMMNVFASSSASCSRRDRSFTRV